MTVILTILYQVEGLLKKDKKRPCRKVIIVFQRTVPQIAQMVDVR